MNKKQSYIPKNSDVISIMLISLIAIGLLISVVIRQDMHYKKIIESNPIQEKSDSSKRIAYTFGFLDGIMYGLNQTSLPTIDEVKTISNKKYSEFVNRYDKNKDKIQ